MIKPIELKPFTKFCVSLGMLPSSYKASLTYEEQLMWFCDFLQNKVIPAVNQNAEAVVEMQTLFTQLQTYINEYFSNLDVQEEINNKLDDMVESGELEEIIGIYINSNAILTFDTINDMIISDKLVEGSVARTLGGLAFNDMNGHLYKIEHILSANPDGTNLINLGHDDLYARLILEPKVINDLTSQDEPTKNAPSITSVKNAIDKLDNTKANNDNVYTKSEIDELLTEKTGVSFTNLKIRGITSNGEIDNSTYTTGMLTFIKRNGMILAIFIIGAVNTYGELCLFNDDDTPFSIPDNFKALNNWYPKSYGNYNYSSSTTLIEASINTSKITLNDNVIFNGTHISFKDYSSLTVNGRCTFSNRMYYMADEVS